MNQIFLKFKRKFAQLILLAMVFSLFNVPGEALALAVGPSLVDPASGTSLTKGIIYYLNWDDVAGATKYEIWIDNNSGFGSPEIGFNNGMSANWVNNGIVTTSDFGLTATMQSSLPQNVYYWKARALDASNNPYSEWSVAWSFSLLDPAPPAPPTLISPANGTVIPVMQDVNVSWNSVAGAGRYRIKVATDAAMSNQIYSQETTQTSLSLASGFFAMGQTYYWQVGAINVGDVGGWGVYGPTPAWSFSFAAPAAQPPAPPTLISPANGTSYSALQDVALNWSNVSGATSYQLKVATDSLLSNIVYSQQVSSNSGVVSSGFFVAGQTYYWQVKAMNTSGWGVYGPTPAWSFSFAAAPVTPSITLYSPGSTVTTKEVNFSWSTVSGVSRYELYVDNNVGFGSPEISSGSIDYLKNYTATSFSVIDYWLEPGQTYYWKVVAHKTDNTTATSAVATFVYNPPRAAAPVWMPLYRLYHAMGKDHFYTTVPAQRDSAVALSGYKYEHEEGFVSDRPTIDINLVPLFKLYNSPSNYYFYTTNPVDKDAEIIAGTKYQGIAGFVSKVPGAGLVPLYYTKNVTSKDNFYTASLFERDYSISKFGFVDQGIIGYVKYLAPTNLEQSGVESRPQANFGGADLGSGAYRGLNSEDLLMDGRGPALSFFHYYNSYNLNHYPMGKGWSHNLDSYLMEATEGAVSKVYIFWGDGATSEFQKNGSVYTDLSGNHDQLTLVDDGVNYGYDLKSKDQTVYQYRRFGNDISSEILLIKITDWRGDALTFSYNAASFNLMEAFDGFGRKLIFSYSNNGQLIKVQESIAGVLERLVTFDYDLNGLLSKFTDSRGFYTTYSYYSDEVKMDLLKSITYPKNNTVTIDYDAARKVNTVKEEVQNPTSVQYALDVPTGITTSTITDPQGVIYQTRHDGLKRFIGAREGAGAADVWAQVERTNSNNPNAITKATDREGKVTSFVYDAMGNLLSTTNAKGKIANFTYNDKNNVVTRTDFYASGGVPNTTTYTYDTNNNRLIKITNPMGEVMNFNYDEGLVGGKSILTSVTDNALNKTSFLYDNYGNLIQVTNPESKLSKAVNDEWGRIKESIDAENIKTSFDYDNGDNLINTKYFSKALVQIFNVSSTYDSNGNLENVSWVNEGLTAVTQYLYDTLDRFTTLKNPLNETYSYSYSANNEILSRVSPNGETTAYQYDSYGRLNKTIYPNVAANVEVLTRDKNGNILSLKSEQGTNYFVYDELMNLTKYTDPYGKVVQYDYDDADRLKTLTYPDGKVANYAYDAVGRLKTISGVWFGSVNYIYDTAGRLSEVQRGNGTKAKYTYDKAGNLLNVQELKSSGVVIASYSFVLDNVENRKSVMVNAEPIGGTVSANSVNYGYDSKTNRLLTAGTNNYSYDKNGNRKTRVNGGVTATYNYDYENRLTGVAYPAVQEFRYDAFGNRIYKNDQGTVTKYVMDLSGLGNVLTETDVSGGVKTHYIWGPGFLERVDVVTGAQQFYHFNGRGDTVAITDSAQNVTDAYVYDEFGKVLNSMGVTKNPFKFVGQFGVMDDGQGLYYMRARYYDPEVGRFISEDPLHFGGGDWNLYSYAGNNPVNAMDPSGEIVAPVVGVIVRVAVSAGVRAGAQTVTVVGVKLSSPLGRSLVNAGFLKSLGQHAHHIVAKGSRYAIAARDVLIRYKIDINDSINGIWLNSAFHQGMHTNAYYEKVNQLMSKVKSAPEAIEMLRYISKEIANGTFLK